jgi:hypothetical protein
MKSIGIISTTAIALLLGFGAPAFARQDQQEKPKQEEHPARPEQKPQEKPANQPKQEPQPRQQQQHSEQQAHVQQVHMQSQQEQQRQEGEQQGVWQQHRASNWQSEHRDWQQRGGYNGYRIPDDRYNGYFGSDHYFRIYSYPVVIVGGYPRFQYGGYWFSLADSWPEYWSNNWYDDDDVYINYSGDGYYLYNRRYPRDRIAVNVYLN